MLYLFTYGTTYHHHQSEMSMDTKQQNHLLNHTDPCRACVSQHFQALAAMGSGGKCSLPRGSPGTESLGLVYFSDSLPAVLNAKGPWGRKQIFCERKVDPRFDQPKRGFWFPPAVAKWSWSYFTQRKYKGLYLHKSECNLKNDSLT